MKFAKWVYTVAGLYGLIVLSPMYFMEEKISRELPPAITHPEYFYGFLGVGVAWQVLFLVLARNPLRYRPMMIPAMIEKVSYGIALVCLFACRRLPLAVLALGSMDWIFAVLFFLAYLSTRAESHQHGESAVIP